MGGRCCAYDAVALARGDASVDSVKGAVGDAGRGDLGGGGTLCGRFRGVVTEQGADVHGRELGWRENGHVGGASQRQAAAVRPGLSPTAQAAWPPQSEAVVRASPCTAFRCLRPA